jgi:hypothetical protein
MKGFLAVLLLGFGVVGCSNPVATPSRQQPAGAVAVNLVVRTVKVSANELLLEVHIYPHEPLGVARLTVAGEGVQVAPPSFEFRDLKPPAAPDTSRSPPNPPPLPRTIIRVFRIVTTANRAHGLVLKLQWHKGSASLEVPWPQ